MNANHVRRAHTYAGLIALCLFVIGAVSLVNAEIAQPTQLDLTPKEIIDRLKAAVAARQEQDIETLIASLATRKDTAVPDITAELARADEPLRLQLVRALDGIGCDAATSLLLHTVAQRSSPHVAGRALFALENRTIRRSLSPEELNVLTDLVAQKNVLQAGNASRVLAKCVEVSAGQRLMPIVQRFGSELLSPDNVRNIGITYMSPRVYVRNQFLLAISYLSETAIPVLAQERQAAGENSDIEKWWVLALGFAGDKSVAADLKDMVMTEPDRYIRCVAVRAYACSAKHDAIPLLESLLTDTTESAYGSCHGDKILLIRTAAKGELMDLQREGTSGQ